MQYFQKKCSFLDHSPLLLYFDGWNIIKVFLPFTSHRGERYQTSISPSFQKTHIKLSKLFPWIPIHLTWGDRDELYFLRPKVRDSKCHITPTIIPPKLPHPFLYNTPTSFIKITIRKKRSELMLVISYYYVFTHLTKVFRTIRMMEQWAFINILRKQLDYTYYLSDNAWDSVN